MIVIERRHELSFHVRLQLFSDKNMRFLGFPRWGTCMAAGLGFDGRVWMPGMSHLDASQCKYPKVSKATQQFVVWSLSFFFVGTDVCSKKNFNHLTFRMLSYLSFTIFQLKQKSFTVSFWSSHLKPVLFCILWRCNIAFQKQRSAFLAVWGEPCLASPPQGLCSPGGFQPSFSAEACQLCPAGTLAPSHGAERCIKCAQGKGMARDSEEMAIPGRCKGVQKTTTQQTCSSLKVLLQFTALYVMSFEFVWWCHLIHGW